MRKMKKEKEQCRRKEVADSCYASGWHENSGTRSRTVVQKNEKKKGKERKNGGERKSRTPVMPRDGMRIEEPGRGPWCENEKKKKKKDEWRRKEVPDFCYATGWHEKRGTWSRTVVRK